MIGAELLQLLQGDPLAQMRQQMAPNPNPQAPPPQQLHPLPPPPPGAPTTMSVGARSAAPQTGTTGYMRDMGPAPPGAPPAPQGGSALSPPQQPPAPPSVAPQSPPDLASLYMRLMQQQRAGSAIDHGLAMMASAYAAPGTQGQIMHSMDNQQQDPGAMMNNLVQLQQMQNLQNARPAIVSALTGGDGTSGGIAGLPANVVNSLPTDTLVKMLDQQQQAANQLRMKQAEAGIDVTKEGALTTQKDLQEAQTQAPKQLQQLDEMNTLASSLNTSAIQSIMASPLKRVAAMKLMESGAEAPGAVMTQVAAAGLSGEELAAVNQLKQLDNQVYGQAFESTGSKRTGQEVANLRSGLSPLKNFNQPFDAYMTQFGNFQNQIHKSMANNYGAAGRVDEIPDSMKWDMSDPKNPKPLVDSAYLPNGDKYAGKGGQWASNPPPKQGGFNYASIPSGTVYTAPDGTQRRKP